MLVGVGVLVGHVIVIALALHSLSSSTSGFDGGSISSGNDMSVTFVDLAPSSAEPAEGRGPSMSPAAIPPDSRLHVQRDNETSPQPPEDNILSERGDPVDERTARTSQSPAGPELARQAATTDQGSNATGGDRRLGYQAALRIAIERRWHEITEKPFPRGCALSMKLEAGGALAATSAADCTLDQETRLELELAALTAQPLPYAGYEDVFTESLRLTL